ncbi:MAG: hypothetical protein DRR08_19400 [Candidatus Parabeggiatoa sp. nov. 2]|nr:MAG: hypothetical protein B6247_03180 [Beggiatoa sp. 4572_84]RKZ57284.1 MAG: hypothetical protein DRR08_19400 [Gammaproteobacteria bacterium]
MPPIATTTEHLSTPLSSQLHKVLQQAADLVGTTLNQFMIQASLEKAQTIIEQEQILRLSQQDAEVNALDNTPHQTKNFND